MTAQKQDFAALRKQFTMTHQDLVAELGMNRETLRRRLDDGTIKLTRVRFGAATSPFYYDPKEVAKVKKTLTVAVETTGGKR